MKKLALALTLVLAASGAARAGEVADHAAAAEKAVAAGDATAAIQAFDKAQDALWTALPLTLRKAEKAVNAVAVGIYQPRQDGPYKPGEKVYVYLEPVGFGYGNDGLGNYSIDLSVDLTLKGEGGQTLFGVPNFTGVKVASRIKNREIFVGLDLNLDPKFVPPGKYRGDFVMHDKKSDKTAKFSVDFEIAK